MVTQTLVFIHENLTRVLYLC